MDEEQEEIRPLLADSDSSKTVPPSNIIQPRCKFFIEPVLFLSSLFGFPKLILDPLLLYYFIAEDIRGNRTNLNISQLQTSNACFVNTSDPIFQYREEIQQHAANFMIFQNLACSIPAFFMAWFLGSYSDKAGRKYALIPPVLGDSACTILIICTVAFRLPTWVLIFSSFLTGLGGNFQTLLLGCFSYVADITEPKDRAFRITVVEMIMFGCGIFSYVGIGYWIQTVGFLWPYVGILGGKLVILLLLLFLVPETIRKDPKASFFSTEHLKGTFTVIRSKEYPGRRWKLILLMWAFFLPTLVILGNTVDTLFEMNVPMCWNPAQLGIFNGINIGTIAIGGIIAAKVLKFCFSDVQIAIIAGITTCIANVYKSLVFVSWMMYIGKHYITYPKF